MKYCSHCGKELDDADAFCPACGSPCDGNKQEEKKQPVEGEESNFIYSALSFIVPIIGIIFYVVEKNEHPRRAEDCIKWTLISLVFWTVLSLIIGFSFMFAY